jgi:ABC-2 type transport system permease protein
MRAIWLSFGKAMLNEFRMQSRQRAMWLTMLGVSTIFPLLAWHALDSRFVYEGTLRSVADWTNFLNLWVPIGYGIVLADRIPRDRRLRMDELLASFPTHPRYRLWGKAVGVALATVVPLLVVALVGALLISVRLHTAEVMKFEVGAICVILLPALLFVTAVCLLLSTFVWPPAIGFICAGLWLFLEAPPTMLPSLANSVLSPTGAYAIAGLYHSDRGWAGTPGVVPLGPLGAAVSTQSGVLGPVLVTAFAAVLLAALPAAASRRKAV